MAPLKFEEKIKEKLEQRAIQPSENSWEKLSAQLDEVQHQKKGSSKTLWYAVAAIFIGVLIVTSVTKNQNSTLEDINTQFVNNHEEKKQIHEKENTTIALDIDVEEKSIIENEKRTITNVVTGDKRIKPLSKKKKNTSSDKSKSESLVMNPVLKESDYNNGFVENDKNIANHKKEEGISSDNSEMINDKVANVVAQIQDLKNNNIEVTKDEINKLLLQAQREITSKKIIKSDIVSASALLQDVEEELDETFKERVFEALKTGFQKVKTTVVQRKN